jgi:hypothetical protein
MQCKLLMNKLECVWTAGLLNLVCGWLNHVEHFIEKQPECELLNSIANIRQGSKYFAVRQNTLAY